MSHTKEPWHTGGNGTIIYDKDGWGIASATVFHGRNEPETSEENAKRIVACVNACAGIDTEIIERNQNKVSVMLDQRDALMLTAEYLIDRVICSTGSETSVDLVNRAIDQMRELIAGIKK
jgi:hypothetical protein